MELQDGDEEGQNGDDVATEDSPGQVLIPFRLFQVFVQGDVKQVGREGCPRLVMCIKTFVF